MQSRLAKFEKHERATPANKMASMQKQAKRSAHSRKFQSFLTTPAFSKNPATLRQ